MHRAGDRAAIDPSFGSWRFGALDVVLAADDQEELLLSLGIDLIPQVHTELVPGQLLAHSMKLGDGLPSNGIDTGGELGLQQSVAVKPTLGSQDHAPLGKLGGDQPGFQAEQGTQAHALVQEEPGNRDAAYADRSSGVQACRERHRFNALEPREHCAEHPLQSLWELWFQERLYLTQELLGGAVSTEEFLHEVGESFRLEDFFQLIQLRPCQPLEQPLEVDTQLAICVNLKRPSSLDAKPSGREAQACRSLDVAQALYAAEG